MYILVLQELKMKIWMKHHLR